MSVFVSDAIPSDVKSTRLLNSVQHGGHLHLNVCKVKFEKATAANDTIQLMRIPRGGKLIPQLCYAGAPAQQSNVSVELVGFTAAASFGSQVQFVPSAPDTALAEGDMTLTAKLTGSGSIAAETEVVFGIVYATAI